MRFLSDLVNCHVIAAPSMVAMFENFVSVTQEEDVPQVNNMNQTGVLSSFVFYSLKMHLKPVNVWFHSDLMMIFIRPQPHHIVSTGNLFVSPGSVGLVCVCGSVMSALGR